MRRSRVCTVCGAGLPRAGSARRRYCSDACRSLAYRERQTSDRIIGVGLLTAGAEATGDAVALDRLLCPVCRQPVLPGGRRRRDARYCSGTCRTRAWRTRRPPLEDPPEERRAPAVTSTRHQEAGRRAR